MNDSPVLHASSKPDWVPRWSIAPRRLAKPPSRCSPENWLAVARLRDEAEFAFDQCMDVCGVDYLSYGSVEWDTTDVSS